MIDRAWRALLLAVTLLLVGGVPMLAQSDEPGLLDRDDGSVLVGIRNDVTVPAGNEADAVFVVEGEALVEGVTRGLVAIDSAVTITGSGASVDSIFIVGGTLDIANGASVKDVAYADTVITGEELVTGEVRDAKADVAGAAAWFATVVAVILFFVFIGWLIAVLVSALLLVAFGTSQARRAAANIGGDMLKSIVAGLIMVILPIIVITPALRDRGGHPAGHRARVHVGRRGLPRLARGRPLARPAHPVAQPDGGAPIRRRVPGHAHAHADQPDPVRGADLLAAGPGRGHPGRLARPAGRRHAAWRPATAARGASPTRCPRRRLVGAALRAAPAPAGLLAAAAGWAARQLAAGLGPRLALEVAAAVRAALSRPSRCAGAAGRRR